MQVTSAGFPPSGGGALIQRPCSLVRLISAREIASAILDVVRTLAVFVQRAYALNLP